MVIKNHNFINKNTQSLFGKLSKKMIDSYNFKISKKFETVWMSQNEAALFSCLIRIHWISELNNQSIERISGPNMIKKPICLQKFMKNLVLLIFREKKLSRY